jgi:hypothetical protein
VEVQPGDGRTDPIGSPEMRRVTQKCAGVAHEPAGATAVAHVREGTPRKREVRWVNLKKNLLSAILKACAPTPARVSRARFPARKPGRHDRRTLPLRCDGFVLRRMRQRIRAKKTDRTREPHECWRIRNQGLGTVEKSAVPVIAFH